MTSVATIDTNRSGVRETSMGWNRKQWMGIVVLTTYIPLIVPFPLFLGVIVRFGAEECACSQPNGNTCCSKSTRECSGHSECQNASSSQNETPSSRDRCPCPFCPDDGQQNETCICFACAKFIDSAPRMLDPIEQSQYFTDAMMISWSASTSIDFWRPPRV